VYQQFSRQEKFREKAQELSFKALMYDNNLPEAYRAMGLSYFLWGKFDEAAASCKKAIEIDPDDFIAHWTLGRICFTEGKLDQALDLFRRVAEIKPGFYAGHVDLAQTLMGLGRTADAEVVYQQLLQLFPNYLLQNPDDSRARLIYANQLGRVGHKDQALQECAKALELSPGDPVMHYNAACMYSNLGETSQTIAALRQAIEAGYANFGWMRNDPDFASLRDNPEFIELLQGR
jgi:tetratricopeptide (TPR) repeat protein